MSLVEDGKVYEFSEGGEYRGNNCKLYGNGYTFYGDGNTVFGTNITAIGNKTIGKNCKRCFFYGDDVFVEANNCRIRGERPTVIGNKNRIVSRSPKHVSGDNTVEDPAPKPRDTAMVLLCKMAVEKCNLPAQTAEEMTNEQIRRYVEAFLGWDIGTFDDLVKDSPRPEKVYHLPEPVHEEDVPDEFPDGQRCLICMMKEATCAFLHEGKAHKIICVTCAQEYRKPDAKKECPLCREECEHIIRVFGAQ